MKTEKFLKEEIIDKILDIYSNLSLNNIYANFGKHKTKKFTDFIEHIDKHKKEIYNLSDNNFHINIQNEINKILLKLKQGYKSNYFPSLLNFDIKLNELLKMERKLSKGKNYWRGIS